jgi:hypothetical protein
MRDRRKSQCSPRRKLRRSVPCSADADRALGYRKRA